MSRPLCVALWILAGTVGVAACGGASKSDEPAAPPRAPMTLNDAENQLASAENQLAGILGDRQSAAPAEEPRTDALETDEDTNRPPSPTAAGEPPDDAPSRHESSAKKEGCEGACDALASMRRAADRVCELDEARCPPARDRVAKAAERVRARCRECES